MPLLWLSLAFLAGILAGKWLPSWGLAPWAAGAAAGIGLLLLLRFLYRLAAGRSARLGWLSRRHPRLKFPPLLLFVFFCLGGLRWSFAHLPFDSADLAFYNGKGEMRLQGFIAGDPDRRENVTLLRVSASAVDTGEGWRPARGLAQVMLPGGGQWAYGQRLVLTGKPIAPPENEDFSYRDFLANQGVYTYLGYPTVDLLEGKAGSWFLRWVYAVRVRGAALLEQLYPVPEAQLLQGILLGVEGGIPSEVRDSFRATGLAHVIAISGFNMSVLSALFMGLFGRLLSRWWAMLAAILALVVYTLLAGAGASVVRAAIMCALALTAAQLGRGSGGLNALSLAAALMCLFDPNLPWDAGFQLSFAATLGLLLYAGPLQAWFAARTARLPAGLGARIAGPVGEYLLCTLAAQAATLPVIAFHFQRISLSAVLSNPLVLPAQAPLMILGMISLGTGFISESLGRLAAGLAWPFAAWTTGVARHLARLPGGELRLGETGAAVVLVGSAVLLLALALREKLRAWKLDAALILLPLLGLAFLTGRGALSAGDGRLHLVAFDLPGGPAVLLRDERGAAVLLGGAESAAQLGGRLARWLPPGARLAGLLVPVGLDQSGLSGVAERFLPARAIFCPDAKGLKPALEVTLRQYETEILNLLPGSTLVWGQARLEALETGSPGCALRVEYGNLRVLLPFGLQPLDVEAVLDDPGVIVLGPGGEGTGLRSLSIPPGGWIHLQTDGERLWIEEGS